MVSWVIGWLVVGTLAGLAGMWLSRGADRMQGTLMLLFGPAGAVIGGFAVRNLVDGGAVGLVGAVVGSMLGVLLGLAESRRQPVS